MNNKVFAYEFSPASVKKMHDTHPGELINNKVFLPLFIRLLTNRKLDIADFYIKYDTSIHSGSTQYHAIDDFSIQYPLLYELLMSEFSTDGQEKRFLCIVVHFHHRYSKHHANTLLFDRETQTMELYEPNGAKFDKGKTKFKQYVTYVLKFRGITIKKFNNAVKMCPRLGLQFFNILNSNSNNTSKQLLNFNKKHEIHGYCAMWSMYLIYLRVLNPNKSIHHIQMNLIRKERKNMPYLIRNFYTKFQQFVNLLFDSRVPQLKKLLDLQDIKVIKPVKPPSFKSYGGKYPPIPIRYAKNFSKCKMAPKNGGYNLPTLRKIGKSYYYNKKAGSRNNVCNYIQPFVNVKPNNNNNTLIKICNIPESKGGIALKKLREIGKLLGIKEIDRATICRKMKKMLKEETEREQKLAAPKSVNVVKPLKKINNVNILSKLNKCNLPESKGGPGIKELRTFAKSRGIHDIKREIICKKLTK